MLNFVHYCTVIQFVIYSFDSTHIRACFCCRTFFNVSIATLSGLHTAKQFHFRKYLQQSLMSYHKVMFSVNLVVGVGGEKRGGEDYMLKIERHFYWS